MDGDGTYELDDVNGEELTFQGGLESGMWWYYDVQGSAVGNCFSTNPSTGGLGHLTWLSIGVIFLLVSII